MVFVSEGSAPCTWTSIHPPIFWILVQNIVLVLIASASMISGFAGNIQNRKHQRLHWRLGYCHLIFWFFWGGHLASNAEMEAELPATSSQISLTVSLFILFQGVMPLLWSAVSELKGRKVCVFLTWILEEGCWGIREGGVCSVVRDIYCGLDCGCYKQDYFVVSIHRSFR